MADQDSAAFGALFHEHYATVCRYLAARTDSALVEDVAAEVFLTAWRRRRDLPEDPLPWLLGTARKCLANQRRSQGRSASLTQRLVSVATLPPESADLDRAAQRRAVLAALAAMKESDRELLLLSLWDGLTPRQIATVLRLPPVVVRTRLSRASRRLQAALRDALEREDLPLPSRLQTSN